MNLKHRITALLSCAAVLFVSNAGLLPCNAQLHYTPTSTQQLANATLSYKNYGSYVEVTDCSTSVSSVEIPSHVGGVPVTSIADSAFSYCSKLTSVTIPNTVKSISDQAFYGCSNLTSVSLPDSVTSLGKEVFSGCEKMKTVRMPARVTSFGDGMFQYCPALTEVKLPLGLVKVNTCTFYQCTSLQTVCIPSTVKTVENWAFSNCTSLNTVNFGGSQAAWNAISVGTLNSTMTSANIRFESGYSGNDTPPETTTTSATTTTTMPTTTPPTTTTTTTTTTMTTTLPTTITTSTTPQTTITTTEELNSLSVYINPNPLRVGEEASVFIRTYYGQVDSYRIEHESVARITKHDTNPTTLNLTIEGVGAGRTSLIVVRSGKEFKYDINVRPAQATTTTSTTMATTTTTTTTSTTTTTTSTVTQPTTSITTETTIAESPIQDVEFRNLNHQMKVGQIVYGGVQGNGNIKKVYIEDETILSPQQTISDNAYYVTLVLKAMKAGTTRIVAELNDGGTNYFTIFVIEEEQPDIPPETAPPADGTTTTTTTTTTTVTSTEPISTHTTTLPPEFQTDYLGDIDRNTEVNAIDAAMILQAAAAKGAGNASGLTPEQERDADVNGNGDFDSQDASAILYYSAHAAVSYKGSLREFVKQHL